MPWICVEYGPTSISPTGATSWLVPFCSLVGEVKVRIEDLDVAIEALWLRREGQLAAALAAAFVQCVIILFGQRLDPTLQRL